MGRITIYTGNIYKAGAALSLKKDDGNDELVIEKIVSVEETGVHFYRKGNLFRNIKTDEAIIDLDEAQRLILYDLKDRLGKPYLISRLKSISTEEEKQAFDQEIYNSTVYTCCNPYEIIEEGAMKRKDFRALKRKFKTSHQK